MLQIIFICFILNVKQCKVKNQGFVDTNEPKNIDVNKAIKLSIIISVLLISFSFFYYYVIFLPKKEQTRINTEKQEQFSKELKEEREKKEAEQALNTCIATVEENYSNQWLKECKAQGKLSSSCIALVGMTREEYIEKNKTPIEEYSDPIKYLENLETLLVNRNKKLAECSCSLPLSLADRVNDSLEKNKNECFKKYPQK